MQRADLEVLVNRNALGVASAVILLALVACGATSQPTLTASASDMPTAVAVVAPDRAPRFTNHLEGYTLRFPAEYNVVIYGRSACFTVAEQVEQACHVGNALIDVTDAGGLTLDQAAEAAAAGSSPDIEVIRTEIEVGGEPAILLDRISTYDVLRKVVVMHGDRLYVLTFVPWVEGIESFPLTEELYETVIATLEFLDTGE
jgi:ABC-type Fe3+-hydroxamate transport system substrate-binding protein